MDDSISRLRDWGCDIDGAMARVLGNTSLYIELLDQVAGITAFDDLGDAIRAADVDAAFQQAHLIKGAVGNMGLTPLYETICAMVEPLRQQRWDGVDENYKSLMREFAEFKGIVTQPSCA